MEIDKSCSGKADFPPRQIQKLFTHERALEKADYNGRTPQRDFQSVASKNWDFTFAHNYFCDLKTEDNIPSCHLLVNREGCLLINSCVAP